MSVHCKLLRERYFEKYQLRETTGSLVAKSKVLAKRVVIARLNNFQALCGTFMVLLATEWTQPTFSPCFLNTILIMSPHLCLGHVFPHSISSSSYPIHWWRVQNDDFRSVVFSIILFSIRISFTVV